MLIINTVSPEPNILYNHINLCWPHVAPPRSVALSHRWHEYLSASHLAERFQLHGLLVEIRWNQPLLEILFGLAFFGCKNGRLLKKIALQVGLRMLMSWVFSVQIPSPLVAWGSNLKNKHKKNSSSCMKGFFRTWVCQQMRKFPHTPQ